MLAILQYLHVHKDLVILDVLLYLFNCRRRRCRLDLGLKVAVHIADRGLGHATNKGLTCCSYHRHIHQSRLCKVTVLGKHSATVHAN